ncbi:hypothetical protein [Kribbella sp. C-35]|uniref:hypothetical protein n=1 Tax=Kribbella sp. C-35 TaxID=2789276 RepID=UPI00397C2812
MGMDAFVPCRCWEDGRTEEPPAPRADIHRTDGMLDLTLPYDGNEVLWREFDAWTCDGCRHVDMEYHPEDFAGTVEALRRIFSASVEIGSPVYWT